MKVSQSLRQDCSLGGLSTGGIGEVENCISRELWEAMFWQTWEVGRYEKVRIFGNIEGTWVS